VKTNAEKLVDRYYVDHDKKIENEKLKLEVRTEQLLRERKEKTENFFSSKGADIKSISQCKDNNKPTKKQIKLPSSDLLYLNHEFDDRESFHAVGNRDIDGHQAPINSQKQTLKSKPTSFPASYDHVKSVVSSMKSTSDLQSKKNRSLISTEVAHDASLFHQESKTSLFSINGMVRTSKKDRRKEIEAKFKNPLEREIMELMEEDIERLSETCFSESLIIDESKEPFKDHKNIMSRTCLLDKQVKSIQEQFGREQEVRYNSFLMSKIEDDLDTIDQIKLNRRDTSPQRNQYETGRSNSPARNYPINQNQMPTRTLGVPAAAQAQQSAGLVHNFRKMKDPPIQRSQKTNTGTKKTSVKTVDQNKLSQVLANEFISVQENRDFESRIDPQTYHQIVKENQGATITRIESSNRTDSMSNRTKGSHFLKLNKYTNQENYPIMEESSDNPFDKFDRNIHNREVSYCKSKTSGNPHNKTNSVVKTNMLLNTHSGTNKYMMNTTGTFQSKEDTIHEPTDEMVILHQKYAYNKKS
jgi:hypothetical protein